MSSVFLLQSCGIHYDDIVQLDELIEHAQFHSDEYGDNVIVFLSKHYGELKADHQREHQEEKKDHEQLPFNHSNSITSISALVIKAFNTELIQLEITDLKITNFHYQAPFSSLHSEGILQPPRTS
jgi:hypothetical protein